MKAPFLAIVIFIAAAFVVTNFGPLANGDTSSTTSQASSVLTYWSIDPMMALLGVAALGLLFFVIAAVRRGGR